MSAEKRWVLKEQGEPAKVARLATALEIPPVLANLLVQRGIETEEEAWQFFNPKLENLHDPFLMKDMRKAVERVDLALSRGESIMVYGDYDVDGTTAVALSLIHISSKRPNGRACAARRCRVVTVSRRLLHRTYTNGCKFLPKS